MQSVHRSKALLTATFAAGLLCLHAAQADILQNFADSVAARAAMAAAGEDPRAIPDDALAGVMFPPKGRLVAIDDTVMRLAPGSKIRDLDNRIVLPSTINAPVNVRYTLDQFTQVHLVWLMPGQVELKRRQQGNPSDH